MKIAVIVVRILLGALLLFSSISFFFKFGPQPTLEGNLKLFTDGMLASGYLMYLVKILELICGLAFVLGRFVPLANVVIFPVVVNIFLIQVFIAPEGLLIGALLLLGSLFLAYAYRDTYKPLMISR